MYPAVGQVNVWYRLTEQLSELDVAQALEVLSLAERARCDRFVFKRDKRDFATAHALLRSALAMHEGLPPSSWVFLADPGGKPSLAPSQSALDFNIAHTAGLVACALTNAGIVGVDVELVHRTVDLLQIARCYFSEHELSALQDCQGIERQTRFIELWTLKEAYLKASGAGLSNPLSECSFKLTGVSGLCFSSPSGTAPTDWHFALFAPSEYYRMAVAVRSAREVVFTARAWSSDPMVSPTTAVRMSSPI